MPPIQAVALSVGAAFFYALTSVLQHSAASTVPHERSLRPSLILVLLRHPRWLLGYAADVAAHILQFAALRRGSLLLVQTLLVSGLLFALPMGAALSHRRPRRPDLLATVAVVLGLGVFVAIGAPTEGTGAASGLAWAIALGVGCTFVLALVAKAPRHPGAGRAACLGAACGILFGIDAALLKASGHLLDGGLLSALGHWEPYVLVALAFPGFLLAQSAFQAGPLSASLPVLTVAEPLVAALIGGLAFHERFSATAPGAVALAVAVAAMVVGTVALARSPLVAVIVRPTHPDPDGAMSAGSPEAPAVSSPPT